MGISTLEFTAGLVPFKEKFQVPYIPMIYEHLATWKAMVKSETNALILATFSQIKQPLQHYNTLDFKKNWKIIWNIYWRNTS